MHAAPEKGFIATLKKKTINVREHVQSMGNISFFKNWAGILLLIFWRCPSFRLRHLQVRFTVNGRYTWERISEHVRMVVPERVDLMK